MLAECLDRGGIVDRTLPEVRRGRVAGDEVGEQERDQRDADAEEDECDEPAREEA